MQEVGRGASETPPNALPNGHLGEVSAQVKRSIPRELIDAYEREQRRLMEPASSPTKAKEATPKTSAPTGAPAGKGAVRPPGQGPPGAPPKAAARPSLGALQRTVAKAVGVSLGEDDDVLFDRKLSGPLRCHASHCPAQGRPRNT